MNTRTHIYIGFWASWTLEIIGVMWTTWKKSCFRLYNPKSPSPHRRCAVSFNFALYHVNSDYII